MGTAAAGSYWILSTLMYLAPPPQLPIFSLSAFAPFRFLLLFIIFFRNSLSMSPLNPLRSP